MNGIFNLGFVETENFTSLQIQILKFMIRYSIATFRSSLFALHFSLFTFHSSLLWLFLKRFVPASVQIISFCRKILQSNETACQKNQKGPGDEDLC